MKGIRMAVLGAALVFGMAAVAEAQGGGARGAGRGGIQRLMTDITVSADVQTRIDSIVARYHAQQRELMGGTAGAGAGRGMAQMSDETRTKMAELMTKRNAEIRALLTPEQQARFDRNIAAAPQGRRGGGQRGGNPPPPPPVR